jgi:hypothetical protein
MNKSRVDIKYASLFPLPFRFIAFLILLFALALIMDRTVLAIVLLIVSGFVLTGSEGTEIDIAENTYREYKSFFFIKSGPMLKYSGIEKIFVNTTKTKQEFYTAHTTKSSVFENVEFNGFLKFDNGTKIHLLRKRKKTDLVKALEKISTMLKVPLEDNTRTS